MSPCEARFVAVVMGGICGEREVSLQTGACVVGNLIEAGHRVLPVCIHPDGKWEMGRDPGTTASNCAPGSWFSNTGQSALDAATEMISCGVDCVFNALHGPGGEDGIIQGFLRQAGLPFTGPDVTPAAITMDKALTKAVLHDAGIRTPRGFQFPLLPTVNSYACLQKFIEEKARALPFPWIVKPNSLGSSVGIELFQAPQDLFARTEQDPHRWSPVAGISGSGFLVEEQVGGRELTCGVIEATEQGPRALSPIQIRPLTSLFFDYEAKYTAGATEEICPADLDAKTAGKVREMALRVHEIFQCAPLSRTDMFLDSAGDLVVLEINTLPGMTPTSLIPQSALEAGIDLPDLFDQLVRHGIEREALREAVETL